LHLFFPGVVCAIFVEYLTSSRPWPTFRFLLHSLVLGLGCYLTYWIILAVCSLLCGRSWPPDLVFLHALQDSGILPGAKPPSLSIREIVIVTVIAPILAFPIAFTINHKLVHRLGQRLNVTVKFAEVDVWDYLFNATDAPWVIVRDTARDLAYEGWINSFSDTSNPNELFLRDVKVMRNSTGEYLYTIGGLYVSRDPKDLTIEFRFD
jgi:hypothetical protein